MRVHARTENWTRDGRTAVVDVLADPFVTLNVEGSEVVEVSYELLAEMLTELGYAKATA